ncbi:LCP family protein [Georgenia wangjunii]|uniref:LCP family protein n=1 Tax=Georgenia wangjunii TaxID=3117730 RepID=UPI002F260235
MYAPRGAGAGDHRSPAGSRGPAVGHVAGTRSGQGPAGPGGRGPAAPARPPERRRRGRRLLRVVALLLVLVLAWPVGLLIWANGQINHVEALSDATGTPGTTYLLAGSDSRADGSIPDGTEGERADTIMVLHVPTAGQAALISLPRDTYTEIPGHGGDKLNAAYSIGGPELLVRSVEGLTGLGVDHYVEIGMGGVTDVVDAVGGVELCLDYDVDDPRSELVWEAGCHGADGATALAFARMRYSDPEGDIGRAERQRQVVSAVVAQAAEPATIINPVRVIDLVGAGTDALLVDPDTGIIDMARMALAFRSATGEGGLLGAPPIAMYDYRPGGVGSTVLLDPDRAPGFFERLRDGALTTEDFA